MNKTELVALARAFILAGRRHTGDTFGRLTRYKTPSNYAGVEWPEFFPVYSHHRDSGHLDESNWDAIVSELGAVDAESVEGGFWQRAESQPAVIIVREGNPFTGWGEWVGVQDMAFRELVKADHILERLESYPVLDDDDFSRREWEAAERSWREGSAEDRISWLRREVEYARRCGKPYGVAACLRAVRSEEFPSDFDDSGSLFETLRG